MWAWLRVRVHMSMDEFDSLDLTELSAIRHALTQQDELQQRKEAQWMALFCRAHFKKSSGEFEPEDFMGGDAKDKANERKMEARIAMLRASVAPANRSNGGNPDAPNDAL